MPSLSARKYQSGMGPPTSPASLVHRLRSNLDQAPHMGHGSFRGPKTSRAGAPMTLQSTADERPGPAPRVSIIIPTHNRSTFLRRSIQSVLAQTFQDFELLVVDDASSDDTATVVSGFCDQRVRYIRLPENRRAAAARNVGIRQARGAL